MTDEPSALGWWTISGEDFLAALARCEGGEPASLVYVEYYANSDHENVPPRNDGRSSDD